MNKLKLFMGGIVAVALAYVLSPEIKKRVKPMMEKGMEMGKEKMEKIKFKTDSEFGEEGLTSGQGTELELERLKEENRTYLQEIRELKTVVNKLLDEIASFKEKID